MWHPNRLTKERGCVDASKRSLGPFLYLKNLLCNCSSTITMDYFLVILCGTKRPMCRCALKPLFTRSLNHKYLVLSHIGVNTLIGNVLWKLYEFLLTNDKLHPLSQTIHIQTSYIIRFGMLSNLRYKYK